MLRVCFNCYGSYTTDYVYQWDLNHTIEITGLSMDSAPTVHFCNKKSVEAIVVQSTIDNGVITAPVPNELLQEPLSIIAYVHTYDANNAKTVEVVNIPLIKRPKPTDYQFTDNVEIKNFERLEADFADFIQKINADFDTYTEETDARIEALEVETQKVLDMASDTFTDQTTTTSDRTLLLSSEGGIKINSIQGMSEQKQYSGKNLFNINGDVNVRGTDLYQSTAGYNKVNNGVLTADVNIQLTNPYGQIIEGLNGKTVTISADIVSLGTGTQARLSVYENGSPIINKHTVELGKISFTCNCTSDKTVVAFCTYGGEGAQFTNIQVEIGDTATEYEPYVGGTASPSPEYPQAIDSVVVKEIKSVGKNLLNSDYIVATNRTVYGVEFTVNNGIVTMNGTVSSDIPSTGGNYGIVSEGYLNKGDYIFSGSPFTYGTYGQTRIAIAVYEDNTKYYHDTGNGVNFSVSNDNTKYAMFIVLMPTFTYNNLVFKPMIRLASIVDDAYEPYRESVITLSEPITLHGIGETRDEITPSEKIRRFATVAFTGNENWLAYDKPKIYRVPLYDSKMQYETSICTHFRNVVGGLSSDKNVGCFTDHPNNPNKYFNTGFETVDEWKAYLKAQYDSGTPVTLVYELADPVIEELPEADRIALNSLRSFDTVTYLSTDSAVEPVIEVEYGTSRVGALALENSNLSAVNKILLDTKTSMSDVEVEINKIHTIANKVYIEIASAEVTDSQDLMLKATRKAIAHGLTNGKATRFYVMWVEHNHYFMTCTPFGGGAYVGVEILCGGSGSKYAGCYMASQDAIIAYKEFATRESVETLSTKVNNINNALPFTIEIDDIAKTINFIDR